MGGRIHCRLRARRTCSHSCGASAEPSCCIGFAGAVGSLGVRFRGARGEERQQLKWISAGALVWVLATLAIRINPPALTGHLGYVYLVGLLAFVAAVSVAILRYQLYDIDLVVNRALVYGGLGACITVVYVVVVAGVGTLVHTSSEANLLLSLVATALVAVIFQPARDRLQLLANRLVYGQRASPYEVLADFSDQIAGALSVDEVLPRMAEAAAHGVRATRSRVRVYVPGGLDRAVAWPPDALTGPFERTVPVFHQGTPVGEIAISKPEREPITAAEINLLAHLAAQAGPALKNVRLDLELQSRLEDLRASRQRIVAAQDAERRRLERDIHDGAQQQFVAIAVNMRVAQELVQSDPPRRRRCWASLACKRTTRCQHCVTWLAASIRPHSSTAGLRQQSRRTSPRRAQRSGLQAMESARNGMCPKLKRACTSAAWKRSRTALNTRRWRLAVSSWVPPTAGSRLR